MILAGHARIAHAQTPAPSPAVADASPSASPSNPAAPDYSFFDEMIEVRQIISSRYVEAPDDKTLRIGALKGMVEALNDPYTVYVPASSQREFNKGLTGEYVGIGAQITMQPGGLTVVSPMENSPALKAGLLPNDRIIEIDGIATRGMDVDKCVDMLQGRPGTVVKLLIDRAGEQKLLEVTRDRVKTRSVKGYHRDPASPENWEYLIDPQRKIAYLRMTQFTPGVAGEIMQALNALGAREGKLGGLILDVRFNPGGLLDEANTIADMFLKEGVIVSTRGRAFPERVVRAQELGTLPDFPIAVLINGESASASEVLAGALLENNRAAVIGSRSFGKGSVQSLINLTEGGGSELKITEQGYYLPSGRSISRKDQATQWGVDPSPGFYVAMTDKAVTEMLNVRRQLEIIDIKGDGAAIVSQHATPKPLSEQDWSNPVWVLEYLKDPQLAASVSAMQERIDTGAWKPISDASAQERAIAIEELLRVRQYRDRLERELEKTDRRVESLMYSVGNAPVDNPKDLWLDTPDIVGGTVDVKDKNGALIVTLKINGANLERWLMDADVEKLPPAN
jgi:carboxyl-terminal processing protease